MDGGQAVKQLNEIVVEVKCLDCSESDITQQWGAVRVPKALILFIL